MISSSYKRYVLGTLTLVYALQYSDRNLVILLLQLIKDDLRLSDTELGLITGIVFGLFYATLGLPMARLSDRGGNRVTIVSISIALWGTAVMATCFVSNFFELACVRMMAAVGEAGCMPPTYSLLADYFGAPKERVRAMTIYTLANALAPLATMIVGGWLESRVGWRLTFLLVGIPGVLVALLTKGTVQEPRSLVGNIDSADRKSATFSFAIICRTLWRQPSSRHLAIAFVLAYTLALGMAPWYGAFFIRTYRLTTAEVGLDLGLIFGICGIAGTLAGGYLAERFFFADVPGQMLLNALTMAAVFPCFGLFLLLPGKWYALCALGPLVMVFSAFFGPTFALMQRLVLPAMRAQSLALVMLFANLVGMGLGPLLVGVLSDRLRPWAASDALRYAMLSIAILSLWSAYHFWRVRRTVDADLATMRDAEI